MLFELFTVYFTVGEVKYLNFFFVTIFQHLTKIYRPNEVKFVEAAEEEQKCQTVIRGCGVPIQITPPIHTINTILKQKHLEYTN